MKRTTFRFLFIAIILLAASFRLIGVQWDQNNHLHPDERFLTMVANGTQWPTSVHEYFDTKTSPLNPHNRGFDFFVYGTFPVFLVKFVAEAMGLGSYTSLTIMGRIVSALFDLGILVLVFLIGKKISNNTKTALVGMFLYAVMALPIQLSHFFAVDPALAFFLTLAFFFVIQKPTPTIALALGISLGFAIASKISALLFFPIIGIAAVAHVVKSKNIVHMGVLVFLAITVLYITVRLTYPYLFTGPDFLTFNLNPAIINNWKQLKGFESPEGMFPPAVQWYTTSPWIFPLQQVLFVGLGTPLGLLIGISLLFVFRLALKRISIALALLWILLVFGYQGMQLAKALRYFYPIFSLLAAIGALGVEIIVNKFPIMRRHLAIPVVVMLLLWPLAVTSIYTHPHTRVIASEWIYQNIPPGKILLEHWDDPLPLCIPGHPCDAYEGIQLPLYDMDTPEKWESIREKLPQGTLGQARSRGFSLKGLVSSLFRGRKSRVSPLARERERFEEEVREQFEKLKEKGLSIPVFTL